MRKIWIESNNDKKKEKKIESRGGRINSRDEKLNLHWVYLCYSVFVPHLYNVSRWQGRVAWLLSYCQGDSTTPTTHFIFFLYLYYSMYLQLFNTLIFFIFILKAHCHPVYMHINKARNFRNKKKHDKIVKNILDTNYVGGAQLFFI